MLNKKSKNYLPPSPELFDEILERVKDFGKKLRPVQERIIQEAKANKLGELLANELKRKYENDLRVQLTISIAHGHNEIRNTSLLWIIECLKNPRNKRFIGQLAIEWFSPKK